MLSSKPLSVIAHNIRSLYNVGSIFRTCDGAGVSKLYLTGYTGTPPRGMITKTALGAEDSVEWAQHEDHIELIKQLKSEGISIIILEKTQESVEYSQFEIQGPSCLILGNEVEGVSEELISLADHVIHIPMRGMKESLNVSVAFGVVAYSLLQ
jgi:tRNA G18 (ribose-2'-O)-methylase SpoU